MSINLSGTYFTVVSITIINQVRLFMKYLITATAITKVQTTSTYAHNIEF